MLNRQEAGHVQPTRKRRAVSFFLLFLLPLSIDFRGIRVLSMDTFFIGHGSPTLSIDERISARHFLKSWKAKVFPAIPRAILMVSGHWDTAEPTVNVINGSNKTIYDFYGFPQPMYQVFSS